MFLTDINVSHVYERDIYTYMYIYMYNGAHHDWSIIGSFYFHI